LTTTTENDDRLLIARLDACRQLSIGETTFWQLDRAGELEVVHQGRRCYVVAESLRNYVERLRAAAAETADVEEPEPPDAEAAAQQQMRAGFDSTKVLAQQRD
jgi:hypothetical protein